MSARVLRFPAADGAKPDRSSPPVAIAYHDVGQLGASGYGEALAITLAVCGEGEAAALASRVVRGESPVVAVIATDGLPPGMIVATLRQLADEITRGALPAPQSAPARLWLAEHEPASPAPRQP